MINFEPKILKRVMNKKGYEFFEKDDMPFNLNIIGIRTGQKIPQLFDDFIIVTWKYRGDWNIIINQATTDPGIFWLENPMMDLGTAILKEGQYLESFILGNHKGYPALQQCKALTVYRDFNRDHILDYNGMKIQTGMFGINIHRANEFRQSVRVDKWSAGCQVLASPLDFDIYMTICEKAALYWGNTFSYTLLKETDFY